LRYNTKPIDAEDQSPPSEAWLFAQIIQGKPLPEILSSEARTQAKREELERRAQHSSLDAERLRQLRIAEAEAQRKRSLLEWAAQISTRADEQLRSLQRAEAEARETWRRVEQFYETQFGDLIEWDEADHPRKPKGTAEGGQWVTKGGATGGSSSTAQPKHSEGAAKTNERTASHDRRAKYVQAFDKEHDLTLQGVLKNDTLTLGKVARIKFTDDEVRTILDSAKKPGSTFKLTFYTAQNLPAKLRDEAEKNFPDLPGDEKYAMQAFLSNQRRARTVLTTRNPAFQKYVVHLYDFFRGLNPAHFAFEKGMVIGSGEEPVLGGQASRLNALKDVLIYLAVMKGVSWGTSKISNIAVGPAVADDVTISFEGGGKLTIRRGAEYTPEALEGAVERAAAGEKVTIEPPKLKLPRPSLTEVPSVAHGPREFRQWFNELTPDELTTVWKNPKLRRSVEDGIRWPRGKHEWLMVARTPKFKEWGLTAEKMADMRTPISQVRFKNPSAGHKGPGSQTAHNEILEIIDTSPDFATFRTRLQRGANDRLVGGADALPPGLRPNQGE
jgi:hypothetical protein